MFEFTKHVQATAHLSVEDMVKVSEIKAAQREHSKGLINFHEFHGCMSDIVNGVARKEGE